MDLIYDGVTWKWTRHGSEDVTDKHRFTYGFDGLDVSQSLKAMSVNYPKIKDTAWCKSLTEVYVKDFRHVKWMEVMPPWAWKEYVKDLVECIWCNIKSNPTNCYCRLKFYW